MRCMRGRERFVALALALSGLAGCGVTYTSPGVARAAGADVRIVPLDTAGLARANATPYTPRSLPAAFATLTGGGQPRGLGALPDPPGGAGTVAAQMRLPPVRTPEPYRIGVGDVVLLATRTSPDTVEELSGLLAAQNQRQGYTVRDDGAVSIPEVGAVTLAGLTLDEAETRLFEVLVERQFDPAFSLEIAEFNSARVAVGGAVGDARVVSLGLTPATLGSALAEAGGPVVGDPGTASIRLYRDGTLYQMPVDSYLAQPRLQSLPVFAGDAIYVDTGTDLDRALAYYRQQIDVIALRQSARAAALDALSTEIAIRRAGLDEQRSLFAERDRLGAIPRDYVYLAGEVTAQSRVPLPYEQRATLADVLFDQGGIPIATGDMGQIYVLRAGPGGEITAWHLDAGNVALLTLATRMEMRPNDIVFVAEQRITAWNRALQQVFPTILNRAAQ